MKTSCGSSSGSCAKFRSGLTLIEMTIVILVLLTLLGVGFTGVNAVRDWQKGKLASTTLREVEVAQRQYLADNPFTPMANLTPALIASYMPGSPAALPTVEGLDGQTKQIRVTVSPPVIAQGAAGTYDPSNAPNDSLWDVGQ